MDLSASRILMVDDLPASFTVCHRRGEERPSRGDISGMARRLFVERTQVYRRLGRLRELALPDESN